MHAHRITPGETVRLADHDPDRTDSLEKSEAKDMTKKLAKEIGELQEMMYAAGSTGLLLVFQGPDTAGKDGAINKVLEYVNVQSTRVVPFKVPTAEELAHDFLWRVHRHTPALGGVTVFNRSHYEDVLVVRVHELVPRSEWKDRFERINAFESLVASRGVVILKFYLHISKEEQEQRLREREEDPIKAWKLSVNDWKERERWEDYAKAYEDALSKCSTKFAPWFIVPSDHKWFRDLCVAEAIAEALRPHANDWMSVLENLGAKAKAELEEYRGFL